MGRARRLLAASGLFAMGIACGEPEPIPPSQLLLFIDTDAPLPSATLAPDELVLFDRLRISVYRDGDDGPCAGCIRDFVLAADRTDGELSAGIAREPAGATAHVVLWAERNRDRLGAPDEGSALSAWVRLPVPNEREVRPVRVRLTMDELGLPRGSRDAPSEADAAPSAPLARWGGARRAPCTATPGPEEACVPGGVVWMGNALRRPGPTGGLRPRLVTMSPFLVDLREVTVADVRASGLAKDLGPGSASDPTYGLGDAACTYSPTAGSSDELPVTCISQRLARAYCQSHGKHLPTEAQHEYLGGGLRGSRYPWGDDDPACTDAVFGRDRSRLLDCSAAGFGPRPAGSGALDVLVLGDRRVVDLAGNVSEWARERHAPEDAPCNAPGHHVDPTCDVDARLFAVRGGSYANVQIGLRSDARSQAAGPGEVIGFRCVRALP